MCSDRQAKIPTLPSITIAHESSHSVLGPYQQRSRQIVRLRRVARTLVRILQPAKQLRQRHVHLQLHRRITDAGGNLVRRAQSLQRARESAHLQIDARHRQMDEPAAAVLGAALVVQRMARIAQRTAAKRRMDYMLRT